MPEANLMWAIAHLNPLLRTADQASIQVT